MTNPPNPTNNKIIVSIEGNIGVGKSTFINILKNKWDVPCDIVLEPIDMWKNLINSDGKNILQTFYEDIPRWAYSFQNVACITRMMKIEDAIKNSKNEYIFLDRSLGTDKNVFELMLYNDNKINQIEHSMYNLWCDFYDKYIRTQDNQIYIYLKASSEECFNRIKKRARTEESTITLNYLEELNKYHDNWLLSEKIKSNVIVIDCTDDFENNEQKQNEMIEKIKSHIAHLCTSKNDTKIKI